MMFIMLQVLTIIVVAIAFALSLAHALELPGKMRLDGNTCSCCALHEHVSRTHSGTARREKRGWPLKYRRPTDTCQKAVIDRHKDYENYPRMLKLTLRFVGIMVKAKCSPTCLVTSAFAMEKV